MRVADFCRENMLDYYEMVEALKQEKLETESCEEQVQCGDLVITEIPEPNVTNQVNSPSESYIKEVMLSFPKGGLQLGHSRTFYACDCGGFTDVVEAELPSSA